MELQQWLQFIKHKANKIEDVENSSNFDFNNEKYNNDLNNNSRSNSLHIGKEVNNIFNKITEFAGFNSLEGFQQKKRENSVEKKNRKDLSELKHLENTLNRLISEYSEIHKGLMRNTKDYLEQSEKSVIGKNVYVTEPEVAIKNSGQVKNIEYAGCYNNSSRISGYMIKKKILASNDNEAFTAGYKLAQQNGRSYFSVWKNKDGTYEMSMNSGSSKLGLWDSGSDKVGIESIIDKLSRNFVRSNKIVNAWTSDKKGATEAILTPWGTIELRDKNKKVIWSTSGTPGKGPVSTCTVDYSNLDTNSGSIQESSISATMGGNCNGKLKPGSSSKYSVKTGNFNENVKGWLETSQESKEDKFTVNWTDRSPGNCCGDGDFLKYYNEYNANPSKNKNTQCTKFWYDRYCRGYTSDLNSECNRYKSYRDNAERTINSYKTYERRVGWPSNYYYNYKS